jgi:gluconokinase
MSFLVLDIGSSSARAILFDETLRPIDDADSSRAYAFNSDLPGAATFDAAALCEQVEACIDDVLRHPAAQSIRAVGLAAFVGNVVGIDSEGQPITPIYLYADTRCADDVAALRAQHDEASIQDRTGCRIGSAYLPARLTWLRRTNPALFQRVDQWVDFGTLLYRRWSGGETPCSPSVASWSGLMNRRSAEWDADWLKLLNLPSAAFPTIARDGFSARLSETYARRWRPLRDVPFFLALGDGAAANIGSGGSSPERIVLTVGTTAALRVVTNHAPAKLAASLWHYRVSHAQHLIGGATSEGGGVFEWLRTQIRLPDDIDSALAQRPRDGHELTFLPLLAGERSPGFRADASGTIHGLRLSHDALDLYQAALEGVALRLRLILNDLHPVAAPDALIHAGGGALASSAFAQILADALEKPIHALAEREITARGVALIIARQLDPGLALPDPTIDRIVQPDSDGSAAMRDALERQTALYRRLYA